MKKKTEDSVDLIMTIIFILVILVVIFQGVMSLGKSTKDKFSNVQTTIEQTETANK